MLRQVLIKTISSPHFFKLKSIFKPRRLRTLPSPASLHHFGNNILIQQIKLFLKISGAI